MFTYVLPPMLLFAMSEAYIFLFLGMISLAVARAFDLKPFNS